MKQEQHDWLPKPGTLLKTKRGLYYSLPNSFHCNTIQTGNIVMFLSLKKDSCTSRPKGQEYEDINFYEFLWQDKKIEIDLSILASNETQEGFFYECFKKAGPE